MDGRVQSSGIKLLSTTCAYRRDQRMLSEANSETPQPVDLTEDTIDYIVYRASFGLKMKYLPTNTHP